MSPRFFLNWKSHLCSGMARIEEISQIAISIVCLIISIANKVVDQKFLTLARVKASLSEKYGILHV